TDWDGKPFWIRLRAHEDVFLDQVVLEHPISVLDEMEMNVECLARAELQSLEYLESPLSTVFEDETPPSGDLSLANDGPAATEVCAGEMDQITYRGWLWTEQLDPVPDHQRSSAVNNRVEARSEQFGVLLIQNAVESTGNVKDRYRVVQRNIPR